MNGKQSGKINRIEKPIPGCLGRMVNIFDLSAGVPRNKLLTDGPHREVSDLDVAKMSSPTFGDQIEYKKIMSELTRASSEKKVNGTPMKMLIAQEMTKDVDAKRERPSLVAKLMGLEALPQQQTEPAAFRSHSKNYSQNAAGIPSEYCQQQDRFPQRETRCDIHPYPEQKFRDVYEISQQSENPKSKKGRHHENAKERSMALIRQKFMEAKRMSMDEKLRKSQEYHDALEVLSSNKDLFLKFLQEPNSMFSQSLAELKSISSTPETKCITVLRPSKQVDNQCFTVLGKQNDEQTNRSRQVFQAPVWERDGSSYSPNFINHKFNEHPAHPTRIVVLKPSTRKENDIKEPVSSPCVSPIIEDLCEGPKNVETRYPREKAKEITQHMCENLVGHRRDETLLSSVYSNGYVGDESSSFNKSDNEYGAGSLSDSEVISPTSRHSWDYINKFGSPSSCSSFSRASCSPESSVCREAKKRLSERWAMMASKGNSHEKHVRKSSSTLGEMLALFDTKKSSGFEDDSGDKEEVAQGPACRLTSDHREDSSGDPPKNLSRSKSLPVSSTVGGASLNNEAKDPETKKTHNSMEQIKSRSKKTSLKGKVAGIFFSRNIKTSNGKFDNACKGDAPSGAVCGTVETAASPVHSSGKNSDVSTESVGNSSLEEGKSSCSFQSSSITSPDLGDIRQNSGMVSRESQLSVAKVTSGYTGEKSDQPSPISILEPPFKDEDCAIPYSPGNMEALNLGAQLVAEPLRSNLIDKSPSIGTIARTLSWDDSCSETATYPLTPSLSLKGLVNREDFLFLVQGLLLLASLNGEMRCDSFFAQWHSHESPLDPSLRDKNVNLCDKEAVPEGRQSQAQSNWKLVFDCVNTALVEISEHGLDRRGRGRSCGGAYSRLMDGKSLKLVDCVWAQMEEWFFDDDGTGNSLVVERAVINEVVSGGWVVQMGLEEDILAKDFVGMLLEEIVEETIIDLTK